MQVLAGISIALLIGASIGVAVRLLRLHRRTGALPELLLGAMLLLSVGLGSTLRLAGTRVGAEWASALTLVSVLAIAVGFSLLYVFVWRVFRPEAAWARIFVAAGILALGINFTRSLTVVLSGGRLDPMDMTLSGVLWETLPILVGYVWAASEAFRYHGMMRRRVELGLAEATVSNRFLLWGVMGSSAVAGVSVNIVAAGAQLDVFNHAGVMLASGCIGLLQTVFLTLTLLPPPAYLDWVRSRSQAARV